MKIIRVFLILCLLTMTFNLKGRNQSSVEFYQDELRELIGLKCSPLDEIIDIVSELPELLYIVEEGNTLLKYAFQSARQDLGIWLITYSDIYEKREYLNIEFLYMNGRFIKYLMSIKRYSIEQDLKYIWLDIAQMKDTKLIFFLEIIHRIIKQEKYLFDGLLYAVDNNNYALFQSLFKEINYYSSINRQKIIDYAIEKGKNNITDLYEVRLLLDYLRNVGELSMVERQTINKILSIRK